MLWRLTSQTSECTTDCGRGLDNARTKARISGPVQERMRQQGNPASVLCCSDRGEQIELSIVLRTARIAQPTERRDPLAALLARHAWVEDVEQQADCGCSGGGRRASVRHHQGVDGDATHFLTKTLGRVSTEMSLHVLAYNLKRVMKILGIGALIEKQSGG